MSVRAKFKVQRYESTLSERTTKETQGRPVGEQVRQIVEMRTIVLSPVYDPNPGSENHEFWQYTPSGEIKLGTINPEAWQQFEIGKEYYVDFSPAD